MLTLAAGLAAMMAAAGGSPCTVSVGVRGVLPRPLMTDKREGETLTGCAPIIDDGYKHKNFPKDFLTKMVNILVCVLSPTIEISQKLTFTL